MVQDFEGFAVSFPPEAFRDEFGDGGAAPTTPRHGGEIDRLDESVGLVLHSPREAFDVDSEGGVTEPLPLDGELVAELQPCHRGIRPAAYRTRATSRRNIRGLSNQPLGELADRGGRDEPTPAQGDRRDLAGGNHRENRGPADAERRGGVWHGK